MSKRKRTLTEYTKWSMKKISQSIELVEVLDELIDGERKLYAIISILRANLGSVYENLDKTINMISG